MKDCMSIPFYKGRYEPTLGHNTKQWWIYDNETDEFCDPPTKVLKQIKSIVKSDTYEQVESQRSKLQAIVDKNPDWLYDKGYRYEGNLEI